MPCPDEVIEVAVKIRKVTKVQVKIEDPDAMKLAELRLSVRAQNCLDLANLITVGDLRKKPYSEMRSLKNFGLKSIREIYDKLLDHGIQLDWEIHH